MEEGCQGQWKGESPPVPVAALLMVLEIREPERLSLVLDEIHDRWFDVSAIVHDADTHVVRIPFWTDPNLWDKTSATRDQPPFDNLLAINHVESLLVEDPERIGIYSFNDVKFSNNQVLVRANENLRLTCSVTRFHLTVG